MQLTLKSPVNADFETVKSGFNMKLLSFLSPPGTSLLIKRFDGMHRGAVMDFTIKTPLVSLDWKGFVSGFYSSRSIWGFTDEGSKLPAGLQKWHHLHLIKRQNGSVFIYDRVTWKGKNIFITVLWFLPVFFMLAIRKPRYKKYFKS